MKNNETMNAEKIKLGETIVFDRVLKQYVDTKDYGTQVILKFVKNGKIIRKVFANKSLLSFLDENKKAKSLTFVEQVKEGEFTHNIYEISGS